MTKPICKIRWIDDHGRPTDDTNEAIGHARCLGYPLTVDELAHGANPNYRPEPSDWFPICAAHLARMPRDGVWIFRSLAEGLP